ncbi:MAG: hypothetical protein QOE92_1842 [Chloroflexota bacterium]|jgi:heme-degrading monooxygenase HmoA|nr:hypothetical protein [Chloroflexota bacterium]
MFFHMSIHRPKPGREQELIDSMHRFAAAAAGAEGLVGANTLRDDRDGVVLVGLAIWESRAAWEKGVAAMREAVKDDPFDDWESVETEGYQLHDVDQ